MRSLFEVVAAKSKTTDPNPPVQQPMRQGEAIRRAPSTDQKKVRRQLTKKAGSLPTAVAGVGAYVTNSFDSGVRHDIAPGTSAHAVQAFQTWAGTRSYDWAVDGLDGDQWQLGGNWERQATALKTVASDDYDYDDEDARTDARIETARERALERASRDPQFHEDWMDELDDEDDDEVTASLKTTTGYEWFTMRPLPAGYVTIEVDGIESDTVGTGTLNGERIRFAWTPEDAAWWRKKLYSSLPGVITQTEIEQSSIITASRKTASDSYDWYQAGDGLMTNAANDDWAWARDSAGGTQWEVHNSTGAQVAAGQEATMVDAKAHAEYVLNRRAAGEHWGARKTATDYDQADFDANRAYWSGQADAARAREKAIQRLRDMKGQQIVVTRGRKVPVGTTGVVFYVGEGQYGWRVGFNDAAGNTLWTDANNVELASESVTASRKVAWTEDGSDITGTALKIMEIADSLDGVGDERSAVAQAVAPFITEVTQKDLDVLEDYNYHTPLQGVLDAAEAAGVRIASKRAYVNPEDNEDSEEGGGWYVVDADGEPISGPYDSKDEAENETIDANDDSEGEDGDGSYKVKHMALFNDQPDYANDDPDRIADSADIMSRELPSPEKKPKTAANFDDPIEWARYIAQQYGTASVHRLSGTTVNAICDMVGDESNPTVIWAREQAARAGTASVTRLSGTDVLSLCEMAGRGRSTATLRHFASFADENDIRPIYARAAAEHLAGNP